ncbi:DUF397 domain-containing protein [Streptomyces sp. NPDC050617]|uniref:DUF397 domain-containing protein n=1 Tax=Streptomyces sp. NPDC050617 TaxID=3154628 RepID=UPI0034275074
MIRNDLPESRWKKSSYSADQGGTCVETQAIDGGLVAVGDSEARALGAFIFLPVAWVEFVGAVKRGELGGM